MSMLEVSGLGKTYGSGHTAYDAVTDISINIEAGDVTLIIGPSGSGKTTLLSMMGTLLTPTSGSVRIDGVELKSLKRRQLSNLRLKQLGFIFQASNLISALTARQNVALPLIASGVSRKEAASRASELLARFGLSDRLDTLPRNLSGGEKQRVAIARALANNPKIILADEPTASLDSKTGHDVMQTLHDIAVNENRAVVVVSHDLRLRTIATRVVTIEDGRLTKSELSHDHSTDKK